MVPQCKGEGYKDCRCGWTGCPSSCVWYKGMDIEPKKEDKPQLLRNRHDRRKANRK